MVTSKQKRKVKLVKSGSGSRKPYVKRACSNCKSAHTACDSNRPCQRCSSLGIEDTCVDAERKKPITRKPRKKKIKEEEDENFPSLKDYAGYLPTNSPSTSMVLQYPPTMTTLVQPRPKNLQNNFYLKNGNPYSFEFNPTSFGPFQQNYQTPYQVSNLQYPYTNETKNIIQPYQQSYKYPSLPTTTTATPYNVTGLLKDQKEEEQVSQQQQQQQEDDVDLYMDLSNLSPLISGANYQSDLLSVSSPTNDVELDSSPHQQEEKSYQTTIPIQPQPLQLVPFSSSSSSSVPTDKKGLTNSQLEDLLKMVWQKQQIQSEEMKEIKKVVNDLKNLMITNPQQQQQPVQQRNNLNLQSQLNPQSSFQFNPQSKFDQQTEEDGTVEFDPSQFSAIQTEDPWE